ncbi:MAG: metal ABC transporter permease, partial [Treponema sp.]|nr:metal ABC transporter permease [Treponema sp.]
NQITVCALALLLVVYVTFNYKNMMPLFFNTDVARAMGINVHFHYTVMVMLIALVVSVSMQLLGAFLIDALLILPVLCASSFLSLTKSLRGIKNLFAFSSVIGFIFSFGGFFISLALDTPPAATIALMTGLLYTVLTLIVRCQKKHKRL